ncbi:hypothetical protein VNO77_03879 [Canavalia gladiata]|uniref:Uncharacterized protein n=1 Tax=Canavalia gladiata TaxID=3824 RepID=A0AAN9MVH3_CANGL
MVQIMKPKALTVFKLMTCASSNYQRIVQVNVEQLVESTMTNQGNYLELSMSTGSTYGATDLIHPISYLLSQS